MTFDVAFVVCIFIANLLVPCKEWNDKKKEEKEEKGKSIWEYAARDNPDEYNNSETGMLNWKILVQDPEKKIDKSTF